MSSLPAQLSITRLISRSGLSVEINGNGSIRRMDCGGTVINLFVGNEVEGGPANIYLRRAVNGAGGAAQYTALLGPDSPTRFHHDPARNELRGAGEWRGVRYALTLRLAEHAPGWFWHVNLENTGDVPQQLDLIYAQDIALAPYGTIRLNEYYVSQYVDHTALNHRAHGWALASRQNLAAGGSNPWCIIGSLGRAVSFATDALQLYGLANRSGRAAVGLIEGLSGQRLQHEHSMASIQDEAFCLQPGAEATRGFFGWFSADHPSATTQVDLHCVDDALAQPEAAPVTADPLFGAMHAPATLFSGSPVLAVQDFEKQDVDALFGQERRHEEYDENGRLLCFFHGENRHVVLRAKELRVLRPHGHMLRTGRHSTPDEAALTSTVWMAGVFHSMLTQGHVSFNRVLSTVRGYLGLFRSHGQRVFAQIDGAWKLLDVPAAFEMAPERCRWIYKHSKGVVEVHSTAADPAGDRHEFNLRIEITSGAPLRFLICHHVALDGDDGATPGTPRWWRENGVVTVAPLASSEPGKRFPQGLFQIAPAADTKFEQAGGDEMLCSDGQSRHQPYVCVITAASRSIGLHLRVAFVTRSIDALDHPAGGSRESIAAPILRIMPPAGTPLTDGAARLAEIAPWFTHNALVHYLSPRGLEQYSGGGWGTRDVCQGPVELLLAAGPTAPVRDLLLRVLSAQSEEGDWPQWFMFFERDRHIRAGDSHGDIVFWPVLALSQYVIASGDAQLLDEQVPFFAAGGARNSASATVWQHIERALGVIERRVVAGTSLAAYGHGDWNDALQPADPQLRDHMCSAWTVTLHYQVFMTLAQALRVAGRRVEADRFESRAAAVRSDFQRLLLVDGVLTGYVVFAPDGGVRYLLHPRDETTGVRYSALAMIHAILEDLFTPQQAREHLSLIEEHLSGPDGVRLFDRPLPYHGGPQHLFQRAESATFFGREIGLMYMHAHLRYAQALAHLGEADRFFHALCQANPIGIRAVVPAATLRQANCYYSSSDAAFADRHQASSEYARIAAGTVALDGGWRIYSSGAGIAMGLIVRRFLGLTCEFDALIVDPVIPTVLHGLEIQITLFDQQVTVRYELQGRGCGVNSIEIGAERIPLTHRANPHRRGAARISKATFLECCERGGSVVRINVG